MTIFFNFQLSQLQRVCHQVSVPRTRLGRGRVPVHISQLPPRTQHGNQNAEPEHPELAEVGLRGKVEGEHQVLNAVSSVIILNLVYFFLINVNFLHSQLKFF